MKTFWVRVQLDYQPFRDYPSDTDPRDTVRSSYPGVNPAQLWDLDESASGYDPREFVLKLCDTDLFLYRVRVDLLDVRNPLVVRPTRNAATIILQVPVENPWIESRFVEGLISGRRLTELYQTPRALRVENFIYSIYPISAKPAFLNDSGGVEEGLKAAYSQFLNEVALPLSLILAKRHCLLTLSKSRVQMRFMVCPRLSLGGIWVAKVPIALIYQMFGRAPWDRLEENVKALRDAAFTRPPNSDIRILEPAKWTRRRISSELRIGEMEAQIKERSRQNLVEYLRFAAVGIAVGSLSLSLLFSAISFIVEENMLSYIKAVYWILWS